MAQQRLFDQAQKWWQTDTAKAISTVAAVLLIPAAVIAYNYASNRNLEVEEQPQQEVAEEEGTTQKEGQDQEGLQGVLNEILGRNNQEEKSTPDAEETPATQGIEEIETLPNTSSK